MRPVVTAEEMRWCDEYTIKKLGIPSLVLMENAGSGVAAIVRKRFGPLQAKKIAVLCGKGNNGGDGFVVTRHLLTDGASVTVFLLAHPREIKGDARVNYEILKKFERAGVSLHVKQFALSSANTAHPDIVVDAMFGTGFSGKVREPYLGAIQWVNRQSVPVVSVDIPSGVNGTTGMVENISVKATETATLAFEKTGLLCNQGQEQVGRISVVDIGIPRTVAASLDERTLIVERNDVRTLLPRRPATAHKYSVGKVFVIAGSTGLTGAAAMASLSALRSGAGAVVLGTPESVYPILARKLNEVMVAPLPATSDGTVSAKAFDKALEKMGWADVVAVGPGLGQNSEVQAFVRRILQVFDGKLLIDADGLNAISVFGVNDLKKSRAQLVLTPHAGEFARLFKMNSNEVKENPVACVRKAARTIKRTVVLKGAPTATATSKGTVFLNSTGNPGMATAGAGDVLAGIVAGLWAQGMKTEDATYCGVYLHGLCGDLAKAKYGERSLLAMDLIDFLPEAFRAIEAESTR